MVRRFAIAFAVGAVAASVGTVAAFAQSDDQARIQGLEDRFAAAFAAKDIDAIMKAYAPDVFVFDVVPPRQYVGWDAYRADWKTLLGSFRGPITFSISDLVVRTDGDVAYSHSIQHVTGTNTDGSKADMTVRVSDVYRKIDGRWLIVMEHVSVPVDMSGKADFTSAP